MNNFDDVVRDIREEKVNDAVLMAAGRRVHDRLFGEAAVGGAHIRGCVDFRTLIPEYLRGGLTPARRMLLDSPNQETLERFAFAGYCPT